MTFGTALTYMQDGGKVKLPEFIGYWYMDANYCVVALTRTGDTRPADLLKFSNREDFEVTDGRLGFDFAMNVLRSGKPVRRKLWSKGVYIKMQTPDKSSKMTLPYFYVRTKEGEYMPWTPRTIDIMAEDWEPIISE